MWHYCIPLATYWQVQRRLFGNTLVMGQRESNYFPTEQQFPYNIHFPVVTTVHKTGRVTWLQAAWQNTQTYCAHHCMTTATHTHTNTHTHTRARVCAMKTFNLGWDKEVSYKQVPTENWRDSPSNTFKNTFETFYILTTMLNLWEKMFKINVLLRCSFWSKSL